MNLTFIIQSYILPEVSFTSFNLSTDQNATPNNFASDIPKYTTKNLLNTQLLKAKLNQTDYHYFLKVTMKINCQKITLQNAGVYLIRAWNSAAVTERNVTFLVAGKIMFFFSYCLCIGFLQNLRFSWKNNKKNKNLAHCGLSSIFTDFLPQHHKVSD